MLGYALRDVVANLSLEFPMHAWEYLFSTLLISNRGFLAFGSDVWVCHQAQTHGQRQVLQEL
jgi:hypothetical protein